MQAIRKFQEERDALEAEKEQLQAICRAETARREQASQQLAELSREVDRLRAAQPSGAAEVSELKKQHAAKQLSLMATIDGLRSDLQREQTRADELESARRRAEADSGHLEAARTSLERKGEEVRKWEDEALQLREELNGEKKKVLELKRAAHSRAAAWKEQLEQITGELTMKQRLEEENAHLRREQIRLQKELGSLSERESAARREVEQLRREVEDVGAASRRRGRAAGKASDSVEEMQILSDVMGGQLLAVEQELTQQVQKNSQLLELFLRHALQPLAVLRRSCRQLAAELCAAGLPDLDAREVPPMCEVNVHELKDNLVKVVNLLRYSADVLEARDRWQRELEAEGPRKGSARSPDGSRTGGGGGGQEAAAVGGWLRGVFT